MSFCVPAKLGIAKGLIEADDIGRKAVADFTGSLIVENLSFLPHKMLQANKVLIGQEEIVKFTKRNQPDESLKERLWSACLSLYWTLC